MPKHIRGMEVNIPYQLCLICLVAEVVGFEPTREYSLLVFKTSAISQTLPHFRKENFIPCVLSYAHQGLTLN